MTTKFLRLVGSLTVFLVLLLVMWQNRPSGSPRSSVGRLSGVLSGNIASDSGSLDCQLRGGDLPDSLCTPGQADPRVTEENINETICVTGYSKSVRPSVGVTEPLKKKLVARYGLTGPLSDYELDHLISLELGGSPDDIRNLWPEPYEPAPGAHEKDWVENYLHQQVCSGQMSLSEAQTAISSDWLSVYENRH